MDTIVKQLTQKELNIIRGKVLVGHASVGEILSVFYLMDKMENLLDEGDLEDFYGTEGWRHRFGWGE
jgi:ATP-dependent protease HslVU (ClpYQ) peptidase subunit